MCHLIKFKSKWIIVCLYPLNRDPKMWKISGFHCISSFLSTYIQSTYTQFAGWCACMPPILYYFIVSYEVDAKHCWHIAATQWCQVYDACIAKLRMKKKIRSRTHARTQTHIEESNHKGVNDTLYYYNDTIVCFACLLRRDFFFSRTNSTSINDSNGKQGANFNGNIWSRCCRNNNGTMQCLGMRKRITTRKCIDKICPNGI